jgi:hypothetical protein
MKLIIGKNTCAYGGFKIIGETGRDITEELCIKRVRFDLKAGELTEITMEAYGAVEIEAENVGIIVDRQVDNP